MSGWMENFLAPSWMENLWICGWRCPEGPWFSKQVCDILVGNHRSTVLYGMLIVSGIQFPILRTGKSRRDTWPVRSVKQAQNPVNRTKDGVMVIENTIISFALLMDSNIYENA